MNARLLGLLFASSKNMALTKCINAGKELKPVFVSLSLSEQFSKVKANEKLKSL
jgi:hypothetical protein